MNAKKDPPESLYSVAQVSSGKGCWNAKRVTLTSGLLTICDEETNNEHKNLLLGYYIADCCGYNDTITLKSSRKLPPISLRFISSERRQQWENGIEKHISFANECYDINISSVYEYFQSSLIDRDFPLSIPLRAPTLSGNMKKKGRIIRSWRTRLFTLTDGILSYYACHSRRLKGEMYMWKCNVIHVEDQGRIIITRDLKSSLLKSLNRTLILEPENRDDLNRWLEYLGKHVQFANDLAIWFKQCQLLLAVKPIVSMSPTSGDHVFIGSQRYLVDDYGFDCDNESDGEGLHSSSDDSEDTSECDSEMSSLSKSVERQRTLTDTMVVLQKQKTSDKLSRSYESNSPNSPEEMVTYVKRPSSPSLSELHVAIIAEEENPIDLNNNHETQCEIEQNRNSYDLMFSESISSYLLDS